MRKSMANTMLKMNQFAAFHWIFLALIIGAVFHIQPAETLAQSDQQLINQAIEQLKTEASNLDELKDKTNAPTWRRPHPAVRKIPDSAADKVIRAMAGQLAANAYEETYIRWHLMDVLSRASDKELEGQSESFTRLIQQIPDAISLKPRKEYRDEPADIAREWWRLHGQTHLVKGYPPFERHYWGEKALREATGAEKKRLAPLVAKMKELRPKWKRTRDPEAIAFNNRLEWLNIAMREYRGELVYSMMRTGDPRMLSLIVDSTITHAKKQNAAAFDLLNYMYYAYVDGHLHKFPLRERGPAADQLTRAGKALDEFRVYEGNSTYGNRPFERNFADYVFHIAMLLRDIDDFPQTTKTQNIAARQYNWPKLGANAPITLDRLEQSKDAGIMAIYRDEPNYGFDRRRARRFHHGHQRERVMEEIGHHALACWALLAAGESPSSVRLFRRLSWVLSKDVNHIYARAMRANMLSHMNPHIWGAWSRRDLLWFTNDMKKDGAFGPSNITSFYGILGLWATAKSGEFAPLPLWAKTHEYWRKAQRSDGSWGIAPDAGESNPVMTAAGVAALYVTQRYAREVDPRVKFSSEDNKALQAGLNWLDKNFNLKDPRIQDDWFYYAWIIQQVGQASGYRTFNGVDWYAAITRELLNRQRSDGTWTSPQGTLPSTSFAMLYLSQGNAPIGIAKLRHDGEWNTRASDVFNLTRYLSNNFETPITWQVVPADMSGYELLDAPILWLSASDSFKFSDKQVTNLRNYIDGGGLLVINLEKPSAAVQRSVRILSDALFGENQEMQPLERDHPLFSVHESLRPNFRVNMVTNGIRPLMFVILNDIGETLEDNQTNDPAFQFMSNLYLYVKGRVATAGRLESHVVEPEPFQAMGTLNVATVDLGPNSNPEAQALHQLSNAIGTKYRVKLNIQELKPEQLSAKTAVGFLSITAQSEWTDAQIKAIRQWLDNGGTLWVDTAGGKQEAIQQLDAFIKAFDFKQPLLPVMKNSPIVTGDTGNDRFRGDRVGTSLFRRYSLWRGYNPTAPKLQKIEIDERPAVIISNDDLVSGLLGLQHWEIFGYTPYAARQLVMNGLLYELAERK